MHTIKQSAARFQKKRTLHHLKQEHDRRISELEEMIEMGIDFTGTLSRIELYSRIIEKTVQLVPADYHLLFILSPDHSISYIVGHRGFGEMATAVSPTTHISSNTLDQLYELKAPVFDINPFPKSDLLREEAIRLNEMIKSFMIAPIISKDKLLGYIEIANRKNFSSFIKHDLIRMEILTDFGALAIENAFLYEKTEELAQIDDLTHVQNFESANKFLTRLIEEDEPFSMIFLDLDGFKKVNQKYGHLKGNEALRRVSDVIKLKIRSTDMICRFGGDEFMIIIPGPDRDQSQQISIRIIKTLESENMFPDVHLSGSVGIAFFPEDGQDIDMMIQAADSAMYKAKSLGKGRVVLFNKAFKGE